ncbi:MAG: hypothetical protein M1609_15415 [Firmicutes bacterium]|nr:hypothetical protein [Bacillota bacterium]
MITLEPHKDIFTMHIHVGVNPQATGSQLVVNVLTSDKESFPGNNRRAVRG